MQDNITNIINNSIVVDKNNLFHKTKEIINRIKLVLHTSQDSIIESNKVAISKDGFAIDFRVFDNIFNLIDKETIYYGDVLLSQKDDNLIYGKEVLDKGLVVVFTDGNPYINLEMILRNILAGNSSIIVSPEYMYAVNQIIVKLIQDVLDELNISKDLVQLYITDNNEEVLNNFANINLVVAVGDRDLQNEILAKSKNKTITSGYEHFEIFIEDATHLDFIKKLISTGLYLRIYKLENINLDYEETMDVSDVDEAIAHINYGGSGFSAAIFTNNNENASKFIKEVKSSIVTVNTSPSIERLLDIKEEDLVIKKKIIYPNSLKTDGSRDNLFIE